MNKKQINSLISLTNRLRQQKYPLLAIIIILVLSLLTSKYNWGQNEFMSASAEGACAVIKIYDGDTMTLQCHGMVKKTKVRLYCIDTPEIKQKPWGIQARNHLRSIVGQTVQLVKIDQDRYGRTVGEVYSDNVNLNLTQVKAGQAAVYNTYCRKPEYKVAEQQAKKAKLGIWSRRGLHQKPWQWRKQNRR